MLKARIIRLEGTRRPPPRPIWALLTGETEEPYAARAALIQRIGGAPASAVDAIELARLERVISNYEADMAI